MPYAPRHSQNAESMDYRNVNKNQSDMYSTLPHMKNVESKTLDLHFNHKLHETLSMDHPSDAPDKYDKNSYSLGEFSTFGHKRSLSGESLGRNLHLAGAKLVLPSGEIPILKPVDKNVIRPKLPPPGPPPPLSNNIRDGNVKELEGNVNYNVSRRTISLCTWH